jgi:hypothetical protein
VDELIDGPDHKRSLAIFPFLIWLSLCFGCETETKKNPGARQAAETEAASQTSAAQAKTRPYNETVSLIQEYDRGLRAALDFARTRPELFPRDERVELSDEARESLLIVFRTVLDYMRALDRIKVRGRGFYRHSLITDRQRHIETFLLGYAAWIVQYKHGLDFIDMTVPNRVMEKLLDAPYPDHELPAGSFSALKWQVIHVKAVARLLGSGAYLRAHRKTLQTTKCNDKPWCHWAETKAMTYQESARTQLKDRAAIQFTYNGFDIARDFGFQAWFPLQKQVAEWMGDTKVRRKDSHLIRKQQLDVMAEHLQPGDILVARHNWYLSNVGLPGFWPHAELFVGGPEEMRSYFDDATVQAHFEKVSGNLTFQDHLADSHPRAWRAYTSTGSNRSPNRVIEAISEGVVFRSIYQAAGADYVGAIRPTRTKLEKAIAIDRAFGFFGLSYDFNFDFVTEDSLVCTELVHKSWRSDKTSRGLPFRPQKVMGRMTLPANELVRQFTELGAEDMTFVYFIDGREMKRNAVVSDEASFRNSWKRPKWDIIQK